MQNFTPRPDLPVHQTRLAQPAVASWARALLQPAIEACRISAPPPLELRPLMLPARGRCWVEEKDRRVEVSGRAVFWSKDDFVFMYVHEMSHRLFFDLGQLNFDHNAAFFALQFIFLIRLGRVDPRGKDWAVLARLYDLQDPPEALKNESINVWLPRCLAWALGAAEELAEADLTGEECAAELVERYEKFCAGLEKEPAEQAAAAAAEAEKRRAARQELAALRELARVRFWYSVAGFSGFFLSFFSFVFWAA